MRRARRRRLHALKTFVGIVVLVAIVIVGGIAAYATLSSLADGDGRTAVERYLDGEGTSVESEAGRFRARFPDDRIDNTEDTINIFGGRVEVQGVRTDLDDQTEIGVAWFDLPNAPAPEEAAGTLAGIVVFVAEGIGGPPADGLEVAGSEFPAYDFVVDLTDRALSDADPEVVTVRAVLVGSRVYQLKVDGTRRLDAVVAELASTFRPR
jgi:hypothetical protein